MRAHPRFAGAANVGYELGSQLLAVGIDSPERLAEVGPREAWLRLRVQFPGCNGLRTLLALQGAVDDLLVEQLSPHVVAELKTWRERHLADEGRSVSDQ